MFVVGNRNHLKFLHIFFLCFRLSKVEQQFVRFLLEFPLVQKFDFYSIKLENH